ncbi:hypothetical protein LCGC14_0816830 [marine sediment metagenome]|uniref:LarC family nickel insertion protein n=1 Tax=marine sediment metagenome TaxID=412755 RepID=A0A0F9SSF7_9ZZZZ
MKVAYFDAFAGISGDMVLGALLDVGVPVDYLQGELAKLPLTNYELKAKEVERGSIKATKVSVKAEEKGIVRTWPNVKSIIESSELADDIRETAKNIFLRLAEAESKIHRKSVDKVHFHEVGAIDSIVDVVGAVIGIAYLEVEKVHASEIATGMGVVKTAHGMLPIPAPATLEILKDVPVYSGNISRELTTPTGAAIIKNYASSYGPLPPVQVEKIGYGAGSEELDIPNVLRLMVGHEVEKKTKAAKENSSSSKLTSMT